MTSRKTKSQSRSLAPAAMVLFTACAASPEGTSELTDEQRERVEELIKEAEMLTPIVEGMLEVADPLFDLEGNPTNDNAALQEGVRLVLYEVKGIWDADRIVTRPYGEFPQGAHTGAAAHGIGNELDVDNWIVISTADGEIAVGPSGLIHEGAHYFYGRHGREVKEIATEYAEASEAGEMGFEDYAERLGLFIETRDAPYVLGAIYDTLDTFTFYLSLASRTNAEEVRRVVGRDAFQGYDEAAMARRDHYNDYLLGLLDRNTWVHEVVDEGVYSGMHAELDVLGVTHVEFRQVIWEQDDLYEAHREVTEGALEVWYEAFPEYREGEETQVERMMETRRARR